MKVSYHFENQDEVAAWINELLEASAFTLAHQAGRYVLFVDLPPAVRHSKFDGLYLSGPSDLDGLAVAVEEAKKKPNDPTDLLAIVPSVPLS